MSSKTLSNTQLISVLSKADEAYSNLPPRFQLAVEELAPRIAEIANRKQGRIGDGQEKWDTRMYQFGDDVRQIDFVGSARLGPDMYGNKQYLYTETEAEQRQHFVFWVDSSESMNVPANPNNPNGLSKKEYAMAQMIALSRHLAKNEDAIGVFNRNGVFYGNGAHMKVAGHMSKVPKVSIVTDDVPNLYTHLPPNTMFIGWSDFMIEDPKRLLDALQRLSGSQVTGHLLMTLDPFDARLDGVEGHVRLNDAEGGASVEFERVNSSDLRKKYMEELSKHKEWVHRISNRLRFRMTEIVTDEDIANGPLSIYGFKPIFTTPQDVLDASGGPQ